MESRMTGGTIETRRKIEGIAFLLPSRARIFGRAGGRQGLDSAVVDSIRRVAAPTRREDRHGAGIGSLVIA
jgi:hypothetical protein